MKTGRLITALCLPALAAACGEARSATSEVLSDSAGVVIVTTADPLDRADVDRWTVGEPILEIGAAEDEELGLVAGAVWLANGTIAIGDAHHRHVRFHAPEGEPLGTVGRRGAGPGEFESITGLWRAGPDAVSVWDPWNLRMTTVSPEGPLGESVTIQLTGERAKPTVIGEAPGGRLIAVSDARELSERDRYRGRLELLAYDAGGAPDRPIVAVPGADMWNWYWGDKGLIPSPVPFGRTTSISFDGDHLWVAANEGYQVDRYDLEGELGLRVRVDREPAALSSAAVDAHKEAERARATAGDTPKGPSDIWGDMADDAPYPETVPWTAGLLVDGEGRAWVRDYAIDPEAASRWTVFRENGRVRAVAELPARFRPFDIRGKRVLGVARDALDVERIRVYELHPADASR